MDRRLFRRRYTRQLSCLVIGIFVAQFLNSSEFDPERLSIDSHDERILQFASDLPFADAPIIEEFQRLTQADHIEDLNVILSKIQKIRNSIMPLIESMGLPQTIFAVMIVESEGNPRARSRTGAAGLWQIMKNTMGSGLSLDDFHDDRYDLIKSTKLALSLLKYYYEKYGDWTFALAAYNAGDGKISSIKRTYPNDSFFDLVEKKIIPSETRLYVPRILALSYILSKPEQFGLTLFWEGEQKISLIEINRPISLSSLADELGLSHKEIQNMNTELLTDSTPHGSKSFTLKVPRELEDRALYAISNKNLEPKYMYYKIKSGDTLYKISKEYAINISVLTNLNPTLNARALKIGFKLKIPYIRGKN